MNAWLVPALAGGLWLALLARPSIGDLVPAPAWFAAGALALGAAVVLAPRRSAEAEPLRRADVLGPGAPAIDALAPASLERGRHPAWLPPALALAGVMLLGLGWGSAHAHRVEDALLARLATERVEVVGTLRVDPRQDIDGWSAVVDVREVRWSAGAATVHESVWVDGLDEAPDAMRGDRVRLTGQLLVPDEPGFASFLLRRGIAAELRTTEAVRLGPSEVAFVRWSQRARVALADSITALFPPREAGLLLGLAVGDDSRLDPTVERDFRATGLSHLLVVSGGNVAMVLAPILGLAAALRLTRWPRFAIGLGTVTFFVVLTGAEPSVMRAGVMTGLALVGVLLGRPRSAATILSAAVFGLLVVDPALVWSVGFQLSVAATGGMVALASPLADRLSVLPRPLAIAVGATLAAQVGVTPVLLFQFHEVPLSTILANVAAFPAVSPALLLGLSAAVVGVAFEPLARLLAGLAVIPMRYLETVADHLARAPIPWITGGGGLTLIVGLAVAGAVTWWIRSGRKVSRTGLAIVLALGPAVVWSGALTSGPPAGLAVRFFDVGQGDAALLTSPGGVTMLVDGGPDEAQVATELSALGVKRLDVVVASHPHADHIVGLPAVLSRLPVGLLLEPGCPDASPDLEDLHRAIRDEGVPVRYPRAGEVLQVGDVRLEILSPQACFTGTESDTNNDALVILASLGGATVLFATEPEEPAQQVMLDDGVPLGADVLKVPHHGAATSLRTFFEAVDPAVAVVSVGENTYGHPVPEILAWLTEDGALVARTDRLGDVIVTFRDGEPEVASAG